MEMSIELTHFMQRHPFIVHADARLTRAYRLFRTMGLRQAFQSFTFQLNMSRFQHEPLTPRKLSLEDA